MTHHCFEKQGSIKRWKGAEKSNSDWPKKSAFYTDFYIPPWSALLLKYEFIIILMGAIRPNFFFYQSPTLIKTVQICILWIINNWSSYDRLCSGHWVQRGKKIDSIRLLTHIVYCVWGVLFVYFIPQENWFQEHIGTWNEYPSDNLKQE